MKPIIGASILQLINWPWLCTSSSWFSLDVFKVFIVFIFGLNAGGASAPYSPPWKDLLSQELLALYPLYGLIKVWWLGMTPTPKVTWCYLKLPAFIHKGLDKNIVAVDCPNSWQCCCCIVDYWKVFICLCPIHSCRAIHPGVFTFRKNISCSGRDAMQCKNKWCIYLLQQELGTCPLQLGELTSRINNCLFGHLWHCGGCCCISLQIW